MSVNIIPHNFSKVRPRRDRKQPANFNPLRRLVAAVAMQAVLDAIYPRQSTTPAERADAWQFIQSDEGQYILAEFVNPERVKLLREVLS